MTQLQRDQAEARYIAAIEAFRANACGECGEQQRGPHGATCQHCGVPFVPLTVALANNTHPQTTEECWKIAHA